MGCLRKALLLSSLVGGGAWMAPAVSLAAENVPIFEYYENKETKVTPIKGKYGDVRAEGITASLNLPIPLYRTENSGVIFNGKLNFLARTETIDGEDVPVSQQYFRVLSALKVGFVSYTKLSDNFSPIFVLNYLNHPTAFSVYRPVFENYLGGKIAGRYTLLLRTVRQPNGYFFGPLLGWGTTFNENLSLDILLPAHGKLIYTADSKNYIITAGFDADARNFPANADGAKGWFTGYHVRVFSQLSVSIYKAVYLTLLGGYIYSENNFYAYTDKSPTFSWAEEPTGFLGGGLEANF